MPSFSRRRVVGRHVTIYGTFGILHNFNCKTLYTLPIDFIPLLWYTINVIKESKARKQ